MEQYKKGNTAQSKIDDIIYTGFFLLICRISSTVIFLPLLNSHNNEGSFVSISIDAERNIQMFPK